MHKNLVQNTIKTLEESNNDEAQNDNMDTQIFLQNNHDGAYNENMDTQILLQNNNAGITVYKDISSCEI